MLLLQQMKPGMMRSQGKHQHMADRIRNKYMLPAYYPYRSLSLIWRQGRAASHQFMPVPMTINLKLILEYNRFYSQISRGIPAQHPMDPAGKNTHYFLPFAVQKMITQQLAAPLYGMATKTETEAALLPPYYFMQPDRLSTRQSVLTAYQADFRKSPAARSSHLTKRPFSPVSMSAARTTFPVAAKGNFAASAETMKSTVPALFSGSENAYTYAAPDRPARRLDHQNAPVRYQAGNLLLQLLTRHEYKNTPAEHFYIHVTMPATPDSAVGSYPEDSINADQRSAQILAPTNKQSSYRYGHSMLKPYDSMLENPKGRHTYRTIPQAYLAMPFSKRYWPAVHFHQARPSKDQFRQPLVQRKVKSGLDLPVEIVAASRGNSVIPFKNIFISGLIKALPAARPYREIPAAGLTDTNLTAVGSPVQQYRKLSGISEKTFLPGMGSVIEYLLLLQQREYGADPLSVPDRKTIWNLRLDFLQRKFFSPYTGTYAILPPRLAPVGKSSADLNQQRRLLNAKAALPHGFADLQNWTGKSAVWTDTQIQPGLLHSNRWLASRPAAILPKRSKLEPGAFRAEKADRSLHPVAQAALMARNQILPGSAPAAANSVAAKMPGLNQAGQTATQMQAFPGRNVLSSATMRMDALRLHKQPLTFFRSGSQNAPDYPGRVNDWSGFWSDYPGELKKYQLPLSIFGRQLAGFPNRNNDDILQSIIGDGSRQLYLSSRKIEKQFNQSKEWFSKISRRKLMPAFPDQLKEGFDPVSSAFSAGAERKSNLFNINDYLAVNELLQVLSGGQAQRFAEPQAGTPSRYADRIQLIQKINLHRQKWPTAVHAKALTGSRLQRTSNGLSMVQRKIKPALSGHLTDKHELLERREYTARSFEKASFGSVLQAVKQQRGEQASPAAASQVYPLQLYGNKQNVFSDQPPVKMPPGLSVSQVIQSDHTAGDLSHMTDAARAHDTPAPVGIPWIRFYYQRQLQRRFSIQGRIRQRLAAVQNDRPGSRLRPPALAIGKPVSFENAVHKRNRLSLRRIPADSDSLLQPYSMLSVNPPFHYRREGAAGADSLLRDGSRSHTSANTEIKMQISETGTAKPELNSQEIKKIADRVFREVQQQMKYERQRNGL